MFNHTKTNTEVKLHAKKKKAVNSVQMELGEKSPCCPRRTEKYVEHRERTLEEKIKFDRIRLATASKFLELRL